MFRIYNFCFQYPIHVSKCKWCFQTTMFPMYVSNIHRALPRPCIYGLFFKFQKKILLLQKKCSKNFFFRFLKKGKIDQNCYNCKNFCYNFFDPKFVAIFFIVATNFMVVAIFVRVVALLGGATLEGCWILNRPATKVHLVSYNGLYRNKRSKNLKISLRYWLI